MRLRAAGLSAAALVLGARRPRSPCPGVDRAPLHRERAPSRAHYAKICSQRRRPRLGCRHLADHNCRRLCRKRYCARRARARAKRRRASEASSMHSIDEDEDAADGDADGGAEMPRRGKNGRAAAPSTLSRWRSMQQKKKPPTMTTPPRPQSRSPHRRRGRELRSKIPTRLERTRHQRNRRRGRCSAQELGEPGAERVRFR